MIGFELTIDNKKISAGLDSGVTSVILTKVCSKIQNTIELSFGGLDTKNGRNENISWYKSNLKIGDEITVKVKEITENPTPINIKERKSSKQREGISFLKKELEEKGLI